MEAWEIVDGLFLIENSLDHIEFEIQRETTSYFRVAREALFILQIAMLESLERSGYSGIVKCSNSKHKYTFDNKNWYEIEYSKEPVTGCQKAKRYSAPQLCEPPRSSLQESGPDRAATPRASFHALNSRPLIDFYPALARIQTEFFMRHYSHSKHIKISDDDMQLLEWVHESIRNEFEHFKPKDYCVCIYTSILGSAVCMKTVRELLRSGNILYKVGAFESIDGKTIRLLERFSELELKIKG